MNLSLGSVLSVLLLATEAVAQSPGPRPKFDEFEVATIKPAEENAGGRWIRMLSAHEFGAKNHTLETLIAAAYNVSPRAISGGPAWVDSERFDIVAKAPGDVRPTLDEQMAMLRKLLSDRFHLTFHREPKEMPVFALSVAKGGPKMKESVVSPDAEPQGPPALVFVVSLVLIRLPARNATMGELASVLQRAAIDHPVLDRTGLRGRFDFDLEFTPDETLFGGAFGKGTDESTKPNLPAALQQELGLKLEATKGPVDVIVIDHADRPSGN